MIDSTAAARTLAALAHTPRERICAACNAPFSARGRGKYCQDAGCRLARARRRNQASRDRRKAAGAS